MATELIPATRAITVPCVVFALRREAMYFRRVWPFRRLFCGTSCRAQFCGSQPWRGKGKPERFSPKAGPDGFIRANAFFRDYFRASVLMLETGVGAAAMESALRWCLSGLCFGGMPYRPRVVVAVGFSGALQAEQHVGDLVAATAIVEESGQRWSAIFPEEWANRNIAAGRLLTMSRLIGDPREKQRLGREYQALAVDMESAAAARICHHHHVPFACLRVISDDWDTPLSPHLLDLLQRGRVSIPRLVARVLRYPHLIGELWRLEAQTRRAARQLVTPLTDMIGSG